MQKLNTKEIENAIEQYGEIVLAKQNDTIIIMSIEEYVKNIMQNKIMNDLRISEEEIEKGKTISAEIVFKELREKYGY